MSVEKATAILRSDPDVQRCVAAGAALRRLGFDDDNIRVGFSDIDGVGTLFINLTAQGLIISIPLGEPPYSKAEFGRRYGVVSEYFDDISDEELFRAWNSVFGGNNRFAEFAAELVQAGVVLPSSSPPPEERS